MRSKKLKALKDNKTLLICSNCAWSVVNFRLPLIKSLKKKGYRIFVVTEYDGHETQLAEYVDKVQPLFISRKGINPLIDIITTINLIKIFYTLKPDYLLLFTIKPVIYGAIAAKLFNIKTIVTITGLGTAFIANNWITRLVVRLYKFALSNVSTVFFQNTDDMDLFLTKSLVDSQICKLTPGSGIDTSQFPYKSLPSGNTISFILIARMIWDKGVGEFVEAARLIRKKYPNTRFQLLGPIGVENRTAISKEQMDIWVEEGCVEYLGETTDIKKYIEEASCVVLPSYREGTSRVLLEAASMGRPLIASNVPGCREVVEDQVTGFLFNLKDYYDLSEKIERIIIMTPKEREIMGIYGRDKVNKNFNQDIVNRIYLDAIN